MGNSAKTATGRAAMKKEGKPIGPPKGDLKTVAKAKPGKKGKKDEPEPTYLDMSSKDEPESEFPTVSKKGGL